MGTQLKMRDADWLIATQRSPWSNRQCDFGWDAPSLSESFCLGVIPRNGDLELDLFGRKAAA
jgi:hypothetical protein